MGWSWLTTFGICRHTSPAGAVVVAKAFALALNATDSALKDALMGDF